MIDIVIIGCLIAFIGIYRMIIVILR